jgi:hypothetical protein
MILLCVAAAAAFHLEFFLLQNRRYHASPITLCRDLRCNALFVGGGSVGTPIDGSPWTYRWKINNPRGPVDGAARTPSIFLVGLLSTHQTVARFFQSGFFHNPLSAMFASAPFASPIVARPAGCRIDDDLLIILDTPNGDNVAKFALALGVLGNVRTRTARAWPQSEFQKLISELP